MGKEPKFWMPNRGYHGCNFPVLSQCYLKPLSRNSFYGDASVGHTFDVHMALYVHQVMPNARLIFTFREPRDNIRSLFYFSNKYNDTDVLFRQLEHEVTTFLQCQRRSVWNAEHGLTWDPACAYQYTTYAKNSSSWLKLVFIPDTMHVWMHFFAPRQILFLPTSELSLPNTTHLIARFLGLSEKWLHRPASESNKNKNYPLQRRTPAALLAPWDSMPDMHELLGVLARPMNLLLEQMRQQSEEEMKSVRKISP